VQARRKAPAVHLKNDSRLIRRWKRILEEGGEELETSLLGTPVKGEHI
jgi:hypothetical protein